MGSFVLLAAACARTEDTAGTADSSTGAVAATGADASAIRAWIDSLNAQLVEAVKRRDTATIAGVYTDDAIVMWSEEPAHRGRVAAIKAWSGMLAGGTVRDFSLKTDDVMVGGDLAVETGAYEMTFQPKAAKEARYKGNYVSVWKRQPDGSWRMFREIDNPDGSSKS
jgi:uncharacterized protein (TIGR02246 family)